MIKSKAIKYIVKGTVSNKILNDGAYEIAVNSKYEGYQRGYGL